MQLSEREKKYVLLLLILAILAAGYFFYSLGISPFFERKAALELELTTLQQQDQLQQIKLLQLEEVKGNLNKKSDEASTLVKPFYPALPQDRILLLVQSLTLQSGLTVSDLKMSELTISVPGTITLISDPFSYHLKDLLARANGVNIADSATESAITANPDQIINEASVPRMDVEISFKGRHSDLEKFIQLCEGLQRTVTITNLNESASSPDPTVATTVGTIGIADVLQSGTMTLSFFAVDKPGKDEFMDWSLGSGPAKKDLFGNIYTEPTNTPGDGVVP